MWDSFRKPSVPGAVPTNPKEPRHRLFRYDGPGRPVGRRTWARLGKPTTALARESRRDLHLSIANGRHCNCQPLLCYVTGIATQTPTPSLHRYYTEGRHRRPQENKNAAHVPTGACFKRAGDLGEYPCTNEKPSVIVSRGIRPPHTKLTRRSQILQPSTFDLCPSTMNPGPYEEDTWLASGRRRRGADWHFGR